MTDEDIQRHAGHVVRISCGGRTVTGKLIAGREAQLKARAPYAIQWHDLTPSLGMSEERLAGIPRAETVDSIEVAAEESGSQIEDAVEGAVIPGYTTVPRRSRAAFFAVLNILAASRSPGM
jgi:hypothetical protein